MKVALIDYGAGNLRSVANALRELGVEPVIAASPEVLADATHLVLPGSGFVRRLHGAAGEPRPRVQPSATGSPPDKPYLGICLGYQILFDSSEETPGVAGLGIVPGTVRRFKQTPGLKIPHMGWNSAVPRKPETRELDRPRRGAVFLLRAFVFPRAGRTTASSPRKPPMATTPSPPPSNCRTCSPASSTRKKARTPASG